MSKLDSALIALIVLCAAGLLYHMLTWDGAG